MDLLFENKKANFEKLISFGFVKKASSYLYSCTIVKGQFDMFVTVSKDSLVETKLIDKVFKDAYELHLVPVATGSFVGKVRDEYNKVLGKIALDCFERDVFKSDQSKLIIKYVFKKYSDTLEFLWKKLPRNAILRRKDNSKWYAALSILSERKIGLDSDLIIEILNLRIDSEKMGALVDNKNYFQGYHMNKKNWVTLRLNNSIPIKTIYKLIDESYKIVGGK